VIKYIPYYEPKKLVGSIKASSNRRNIGIFRFILKRISNYFFGWIAYYCPINSIRILLHRWRGVKIGENVFIGYQCILDHSYPEYLYIGDNVSLAGDVYLLAHSNPFKHFKGTLLSYVAPVIIKENVWLGIRTTVLPGVVIEKNSVISAGAVISKNIPEYVIVSGNPPEIVANVNRNRRS